MISVFNFPSPKFREIGLVPQGLTYQPIRYARIRLIGTPGYSGPSIVRVPYVRVGLTIQRWGGYMSGRELAIPKRGEVVPHII